MPQLRCKAGVVGFQFPLGAPGGLRLTDETAGGADSTLNYLV